jgi:hypothetical protein
MDNLRGYDRGRVFTLPDPNSTHCHPWSRGPRLARLRSSSVGAQGGAVHGRALLPPGHAARGRDGDADANDGRWCRRRSTVVGRLQLGGVGISPRRKQPARPVLLRRLDGRREGPGVVSRVRRGVALLSHGRAACVDNKYTYGVQLYVRAARGSVVRNGLS